MTADTQRKVFRRNRIINSVDEVGRITIKTPINRLIERQLIDKLKDAVYLNIKITTQNHVVDLVKWPTANAITERLYEK